MSDRRNASEASEAYEDGAGTEDDGSRRGSFGHHARAFVAELLGVAIGAIIVASVLRAFVGQMFVIPSDSMEDTLRRSDRVVVEKITEIERGQVVVFADPGGWLSGPAAPERGPVGQALEFVGVLPDLGTGHLIKRVIGMPGDHVVCCDTQGRITVNDVPLDETAYLHRGPDGRPVDPSTIAFDVTVPANRIFVLGDNRADSRDSRCHLTDTQAGGARGDNAFVSLDLVVGRTVAVVWPVSDLKTLPVPSTFESVPTGKLPAPSQALITSGPRAGC